MLRRSITIDLMKAAAAVWVILLHCIYGEHYEQLHMLFWAQMAVPVFMIINGYTYQMSSDKRHITGTLQWFDMENCFPKLIRICVPFGFIIILELLLKKFFLRDSCSFLPWLLTGGTGPGSYYIPLLLQILILFPVLRMWYKKNPLTGFIQVTLISFGAEVIFSIFELEEKLYSYCISRYLPMLYLGIVLYERGNELRKGLLPFLFFLFGSAFLYLPSHTEYTPQIFNGPWFFTTAPCALYVFPLILWIMALEPWVMRNIIFHKLAIVGKASYHIYLVQKVYYGYFYNKLCINNGYFRVLINLFICLVVGILFYFADVKLNHFVVEKWKSIINPDKESMFC